MLLSSWTKNNMHPFALWSSRLHIIINFVSGLFLFITSFIIKKSSGGSLDCLLQNKTFPFRAGKSLRKKYSTESAQFKIIIDNWIILTFILIIAFYIPFTLLYFQKSHPIYHSLYPHPDNVVNIPLLCRSSVFSQLFLENSRIYRIV